MGTGDYAFRRNSAGRTFGKTVFPPEEDWKIGKQQLLLLRKGLKEDEKWSLMLVQLQVSGKNVW